MTETLCCFTAQRLTHAMDAATGLGEHCHIGIIDHETSGAYFCVEVGCRER